MVNPSSHFRPQLFIRPPLVLLHIVTAPGDRATSWRCSLLLHLQVVLASVHTAWKPMPWNSLLGTGYFFFRFLFFLDPSHNPADATISIVLRYLCIISFDPSSRL